MADDAASNRPFLVRGPPSVLRIVREEAADRGCTYGAALQTLLDDAQRFRDQQAAGNGLWLPLDDELLDFLTGEASLLERSPQQLLASLLRGRLKRAREQRRRR